MIGLTEEQKQYISKEGTEEDTKSGLTARVEWLEKEKKILADILMQLVYDLYSRGINSQKHSSEMINKLMEVNS